MESVSSYGDLVALSALSDALNVNTSLVFLDISGNFISDVGVGALANALKVNHTLKELNLSHTESEPSKIIALAEALLVNTGLAVLKVDSDYGQDSGRAAEQRAVEALQRAVEFRQNTPTQLTVTADQAVLA